MAEISEISSEQTSKASYSDTVIYTFESHLEQLNFKFGEHGNRVVGVPDDDNNMTSETLQSIRIDNDVQINILDLENLEF